MPNSNKKTNNQKILTPGKSGNVEIQHFSISKVQSVVLELRTKVSGERDTYIPPGGYVRLRVDNELMMSDTPAELAMTEAFVRRAHGHVLIAGLGLGLVVLALFKKPEVESVTVIEKNVDVIRLTYPRIEKALRSENAPFTVSHKDAFVWKPKDLISMPGARVFNCILHDIWPDITDLNLPNMFKLKRRYAHWLDRSDPDRFQFVWSEKEARWMRRIIKKKELASASL